ncbi:MAG: glycosyltransferase family 39 protein [Bacilli bacterium]|nr:glycosyltransferase family 39 protein [Bacilli bacterium]
MISKINDYISRHEKTIFCILILLFVFVFSSIYIFTTFPISSGWGQHYSNLMMSGKTPYKDFYYYLPPYNLFFDTLLWKLSFGHFIVYVLFRLAERLLIFALLYKLLCKFVKPKIAFISTICASIMFSATIYDLVGDYNQTMFLYALLVAGSFIKYIEYFYKNNKNQYWQLFISGILIGLSFTLKQPLFVAEIVLYFPILTYLFILNKKKLIEYFKSVFITAFGFAVPTAIICGYLLYKGAFNYFLLQTYLGSTGKGSIISLLLVLYDCCFKFKFIIISLLILLFAAKLRKHQDNNKDNNLFIYGLVLLVTIYNVYINYINTFDSIIHNIIGFLAIVVLVAIVLVDYFNNKDENDNISYVILFFGILLILLALIIKNNYSQLIYTQTASFSFLPEICSVSVLIAILIIIYFLFKLYKFKKLTYWNYMWLFLLLGAVVFEFSCSMGSLSVHIAGASFTVSVLLSLILSTYKDKYNIIKYSSFVFALFLSLTVFSQKVTSSYSWWGWSQPTLDIKNLHTIDVPGLEGYLVPKDIKNMYEEMYKVVKENTDDNSVIYGFPYCSVFNVLLDNNNLSVFVPIPWYDVSTDTYIIQDTETLKRNNPDIFVWVDIPNALELHENTFRNGVQLAQRDIQEWISKMVYKGKYVLIGQYNSVFIYKLNDGSKINYTYIKNKKKKNTTLIDYNSKNMKKNVEKNTD